MLQYVWCCGLVAVCPGRNVHDETCFTVWGCADILKKTHIERKWGQISICFIPNTYIYFIWFLKEPRVNENHIGSFSAIGSVEIEKVQITSLICVQR